MNHLEIEFKTLLTKEEYHSLEDFFKDQTPIQQTNHYIDTPDKTIRNHQMALRIRDVYKRQLQAFRSTYGIPTVPGFLHVEAGEVSVRCDSSMSEEEIKTFAHL